MIVGRHLLIALLIAFASLPAFARKRPPNWTWSLDASLGWVYDDNVIGLSERDRNLYLKSADGIPTPLESADDLDTQVQLHPSMRWRTPQRLYANVDYRLKVVKRVSNGFTDYQTHSLGLSCRPQGADYRWSIRYRALLIPSFYLRVYRDVDFAEQHSTRYRQLDHSVSARYRLSGDLWVEGNAGGGSYYYNSKFTEYDSEYAEGGGGLAYTTSNGSQFRGAYTRRVSDNIGAYAAAQGADNENFEDSEYGEADYNEDDFLFSLQTPIGRLRTRPVKGELSVRHRRRVYTTERALEQDPFHRSRLDARTQFTFAISAGLTRKLSSEISVGYDERDTLSDRSSVEAVKDFVRHEYGLTFTYDIR